MHLIALDYRDIQRLDSYLQVAAQSMRELIDQVVSRDVKDSLRAWAYDCDQLRAQVQRSVQPPVQD